MEKIIQLIHEAFSDYVQMAEAEIGQLQTAAEKAVEELGFAMQHPTCLDAAQEAYIAVSLVGLEPAVEQIDRLYSSVDRIMDFSGWIQESQLASDALRRADEKLQTGYQLVAEIASEFGQPLETYVEKQETWNKYAVAEDAMETSPAELQAALEYCSTLAYMDVARLEELAGLDEELVAALGYCSPMCIRDAGARAAYIQHRIRLEMEETREDNYQLLGKSM